MCPAVFPGCTDSMAYNYRSVATEDDGSCTYMGCLESHALNYDESATLPASCVYPIPGCMSSSADNYYSIANVPSGGCIHPGCTDSTRPNYDPFANLNDGSCLPLFYGCTNPQALNFVVAPVCAGPTEPCFYDSACPEVGGSSSGHGCNAGGHAGCRFWCASMHVIQTHMNTCGCIVAIVHVHGAEEP